MLMVTCRSLIYVNRPVQVWSPRRYSRTEAKRRDREAALCSRWNDSRQFACSQNASSGIAANAERDGVTAISLL